MERWGDGGGDKWWWPGRGIWIAFGFGVYLK